MNADQHGLGSDNIYQVHKFIVALYISGSRGFMRWNIVYFLDIILRSSGDGFFLTEKPEFALLQGARNVGKKLYGNASSQRARRKIRLCRSRQRSGENPGASARL